MPLTHSTAAQSSRFTGSRPTNSSALDANRTHLSAITALPQSSTIRSYPILSSHSTDHPPRPPILNQPPDSTHLPHLEAAAVLNAFFPTYLPTFFPPSTAQSPDDRFKSKLGRWRCHPWEQPLKSSSNDARQIQVIQLNDPQSIHQIKSND